MNVSLSQLRAILDWYFETVRPEAAALTVPSDPSPTLAKPSPPGGSGSLGSPFLDQSAENKASPSPIPDLEWVVSSRPLTERLVRAWPKIVAVAVLGFLLLGMIVYVTTNTDRIKIEVPDPKGAARIAPSVSGAGAAGKDSMRPDLAAGGSPAGPARASVGEPPAPLANAPSLAKEPALSPAVGTTSTKGGFQLLFNGKDLTGWKTHPKQPGDWRVEDGILVGSGRLPASSIPIEATSKTSNCEPRLGSMTAGTVACIFVPASDRPCR